MKQPTSKAGESLPMYEKIALLLKHDSSCAVEKTGVCSCSFYDVANQLTELGQQAIAQERERILKELAEVGVYAVNVSSGIHPHYEHALLYKKVKSIITNNHE